ncbi:hypothetical protein C0J52_07077 [Blattella germanica]|nr:hypothetical protein C0J52_07077 [Blattella germanica]
MHSAWVVVLGPWISPSGVSVVAAGVKSEHSANCVIKRIYAGGDHCFATVTHQRQARSSEMVDQDLMSYLETVFSSQACLNCSFLLPNDEHYCCTSRHHGVSLSSAETCFTAVGRVENDSIKELISNCVVENLLPSLALSPPDVESLRLYLTLPLYHEFDNPKNYSVLHNPFGRTFLNLKMEAGKIVATIMFQSINWDQDLVVPLEVLKKLNKLNQTIAGLMVPYDTFYLTELTEKVDVRLDYLKWLMTKDPNLKQRLYFCGYPFLFDAQAKTLLLQTDQSLQSAMNQAATRALTSLLFSPFLAANISTFLEFTVSRENLVADTIRELARYESSDLKKPLKIKFENEEAEDAGGVTKEFFMLLLREVLDPKYGMFRQYEETRTIWFSEDSFEDEIMYYLIGNENYDWEELQRNAEYKNGYNENDETIKFFWEVFHELPEEEKKKFLMFLTGCVRIPIQGMKAIKIFIQPTTDDKYLPVAHTCFNLLDLPRYSTKEKLRYKLLQAIQQTQGFSLV